MHRAQFDKNRRREKNECTESFRFCFDFIRRHRHRSLTLLIAAADIIILCTENNYNVTLIRCM